MNEGELFTVSPARAGNVVNDAGVVLMTAHFGDPLLFLDFFNFEPEMKPVLSFRQGHTYARVLSACGVGIIDVDRLTCFSYTG